MPTIDLTAAAILAIPADEPERLFANNAAEARAEYHRLALYWHPDRNADPQAKDVTALINRLYDIALERIANGTWRTPGLLEVRGIDGKLRRIRFRRRRRFELGEMVYGDSVLVYLIRPEFSDLARNARSILGGLRYHNAAMEKEVSQYLPKLHESFRSDDETRVVVMAKTPDMFLARDVLETLGGQIDARHVAWMTGAIYNIACYLGFAGLTHNAISADTFFISPRHHTGFLLGGWWYAARSGAALAALPPLSHRYAPPDILRAKRADCRLDLALVQAMARELLGDITGMSLTLRNAAPSPMIDFLRHPAAARAAEEYRAWSQNILPASFGARRFVELSISASDIYSTGD
ncbi:MAG: molecular chaperone DnaJ [Candidatus Kapaibacterium sp.]